MKRRRLYFGLQIAGWSTHAAVNIMFAALGGGLTWGVVLWCVWADAAAGLASHLLRQYSARQHWLSLSVARAFPRVLLACVLLGTAVTALALIPLALFSGLRHGARIQLIYALPPIFIWSVTLFLWAALYFGIHYFERYQTSEVEKLRLAVVAKDAQMRALLAQVNPHFMFNCLNSLRALIAEDPERAKIMVTELAGVLRYALQSDRTETVPLRCELEAVSAYLRLESIRFEERLAVTIETDPAALDVAIPPMVLQALVENGIKHGIATLARGGEIRIVTVLSEGRVTVRIYNSGHLREVEDSTRIGIGNVRERLKLLFGESAGLRLANSEPGEVLAELYVPFRSAVA